MCHNLKIWGKSYSKKHGYISIAVCIFGIVANILNVLVLTRKEMNASPINKILAGMLNILNKMFSLCVGIVFRLKSNNIQYIDFIFTFIKKYSYSKLSENTVHLFFLIVKKLLKLMMLIEDVFAWQLNLEIYIKHAMLENVKWKFDAENEVTWKSITFNL